MKVHVFDELPSEFFNLEVNELHTIMPGPSIYYIKGEIDQPVFISTLLHGDETTGIYALQQWLKPYQQGKKLPRSLLLFFGNIKAAQHGVRYLAEQHDYNRIWRNGDSIEHNMAQEVLKIAKEYNPFACIDIHNNSGRNPHHACINKLNSNSIHLASLFHDKIIYFTRPDEVLSNAFARFCPSLVIECGQFGGKETVPVVVDYLEKIIRLTEIGTPLTKKVSIYHSLGCIKIPEGKEISFSKEESDDKSIAFRFIENFDDLNFEELSKGTLLGWRYDNNAELSITDEHGQEISSKYIDYSNNEIRVKSPIIASMFTKNIASIRLDCLGYIMKEISFS